MRCWEDGGAPTAQDPAYTSPRWFYVSVAGRVPHAGGWLHSSQVPEDEQVPTPACSAEILAQYPVAWVDPGPVTLSISGSCTTQGGMLVGISSGFTPGGPYDVVAAYPDGSPYGGLRGGTAGDDGSIVWEWPCEGDPAGEYTTWVVDTATGRTTGEVHFTIDNPTPAVTTAPPAAPVATAPPATAPAASQPQAPATTAPPATAAPPPTAAPQPKPVIANFVVYAHGGGRAGAAFDLSWQEGRDPMTCEFYVDGVLSWGPVQCGVRPSKQFQLPTGTHTFAVRAHDAFGVYADSPAPITRDVY